QFRHLLLCEFHSLAANTQVGPKHSVLIQEHVPLRATALLLSDDLLGEGEVTTEPPTCVGSLIRLQRQRLKELAHIELARRCMPYLVGPGTRVSVLMEVNDAEIKARVLPDSTRRQTLVEIHPRIAVD